MEAFKGPLGSHKNYIHYIVFENYQDYQMLCGLNTEHGKDKTSDKYKEFRYFLNVIESMNNVLDYLYFDHEDQLSELKLNDYKKSVWDKYPELKDLANIANAYKHCVREWRGDKNLDLPWAKDLQKPELQTNISLSPSGDLKVNSDYNFIWPMPEHESILEKAFVFWFKYVQHDGCNLITV